MPNDFSKMFYKINEVAEIVGVSPSTLRFWENEFPDITPKRSNTNLRYYTPTDIEKIRLIHYLLKEKGLKIEAAKEQLKHNRKNISKKLEIIDRLKIVRNELEGMLQALGKRK